MFIFVLAKNVLLCHFILFVFPPQSLVTIAPLKQLIVTLRIEEQFYYLSEMLLQQNVFIHRARCQENLSCNVVPSKQLLKTAILDNKESSTGFLM